MTMYNLYFSSFLSNTDKKRERERERERQREKDTYKKKHLSMI